MIDNTFRSSAEAARAAAAATKLPNVRDRLLKSAEAYDVLADHAERTTQRAKVRTAESAARLADREDATDGRNS